ncbi:MULTISPECIES: glycosyltransferase family 2 protein [unclassified Gilliamella]|uniref:glycosyltransferase family 2 protein n=1 Tax=unclassified Gilliamella TaxID=2685620 RepID=UPI001327B85F|nr:MULTISPECIES: glycosyltransferase family 2 protein [unclassified Gilliamella]MWN31263.1 glycosyltransferase [Gilliamella sp. Pra-s60]MWP29902.1 glycosyltransferase [Gilliamella sp. Pra-s54]
MEIEMPLVSIIIPVYNSSKFILATLASLENQSYNNYEIILINDGSTDNSHNILENYKKKHNNVILYNQKNRGVSVARNKGIELSNGEFITFLDSDDTYSPNYLEKLLRRQKEENADLVYCGYNIIKNSDKSTVVPCLFKEGNILNFYLQRNGYFHFSGMLIRKNILLEKQIYFEVGRSISEDLLFTVQLLNNANCYCVKEHLFNYIQRPDSVMSSSWSKNKWLSDIKGREKILLYLTNNYDKNNKKEVLQLASEFIFQREISYMIDCIKKWKYKEINNYLIESNFIKKEQLFQEGKLNKKDKKKFLIIKKKNYVIWFFYTLYYRFLRFNW